MKSIITFIKEKSKRPFATAMAVMLLAVPVTVSAGFFPDRPIKDWNNPADRSGFNHTVFNSFVNTPYYGDERHFLDTRAGDGNHAADNYKDVLQGVKPGDVLTLRTYVHNNGNQSLNGPNFDGPTVAKNTRVRILLPTGTAQSLRATSFISADNAQPQVVSDTTDFKGETPFNVEYIPGSATLVTGVDGGKSFKVSDEIVDDGALIGYDEVNGVVPGCFQYQAFVYIKVKVQAPALELEKKVKIGDGKFQERVDAKPGDTVKWLLSYKNSGTAQINNTVIKDELPDHLDLVDGSVRLVDAKHPDGLKLDDGDLFDANGVNAGSYTAGSNGYITFDTKVASADELPDCVMTLKNIAKSRADDVPEEEDDARVVVTREDCAPEELPKTGAGSIIGIFAATTIAGTVAHRYIQGRRYEV